MTQRGLKTEHACKPVDWYQFLTPVEARLGFPRGLAALRQNPLLAKQRMLGHGRGSPWRASAPKHTSPRRRTRARVFLCRGVFFFFFFFFFFSPDPTRPDLVTRKDKALRRSCSILDGGKGDEARVRTCRVFSQAAAARGAGAAA